MDHVRDLDLPGGGHTSVVGADGGGAGDPVVVLLPALGVAAGYYGPFVDSLAAQGIATLVADFPGQGVSRPLASRRHDYGYATLSSVVDATVSVAKQRYAGRPVTLLGHSLGGQVAAVHLATHSSGVSALVLIGSGSPYWRTYPKRLRLLAQTQFVGLVTRLRGHWPGHRLGFGGRQARQLMTEWARFARGGSLVVGGRGSEGAARVEGAARADGAVEPDFAAVRLPVLALTLDNDDLAPQGSVDHLVGKLSGASVEKRFLSRSPGVDGLPGLDHFSWARHPGELPAEIATWLRAAVDPH